MLTERYLRSTNILKMFSFLFLSMRAGLLLFWSRLYGGYGTHLPNDSGASSVIATGQDNVTKAAIREKLTLDFLYRLYLYCLSVTDSCPKMIKNDVKRKI